MRLQVLDIGSNTVHLLVVDAYPGAAPLPAFSHKVDLRLAEHLDPDNTLFDTGEKQLTTVVSKALRIAEDKGVEDVIAFATSAIRDADNGDACSPGYNGPGRTSGCCPASTRPG